MTQLALANCRKTDYVASRKLCMPRRRVARLSKSLSFRVSGDHYHIKREFNEQANENQRRSMTRQRHVMPICLRHP